MQNLEQTNSETRVLTDEELDDVSGGNIFGRIVHAIHDLFSGPRRPSPFDRPPELKSSSRLAQLKAGETHDRVYARSP